MSGNQRTKVTLRDIANDLDLTIHTVSKALRGLPGMSESTRKAVVQRARELGYRTKEQEAGILAERISSAYSKPRRFAMLVTGDSVSHRLQLQGARRRLNELGHAFHSLLLPEQEVGPAAFAEWLDCNGLEFVDGLFLTAMHPEWMEKQLLALDMPKVMLNYPPDLAEVDSVIWDVELAIHQAVEALYLAGHRRILYVGDHHSYRGFRVRWRAFCAAAERLGLDNPAADDRHYTIARREPTQWMEMLMDRIASGNYSAVISTIPQQAEWVQMAARMKNLSIPHDLSLVGIEHERLPNFPQLSRPYLMAEEAGERAAELILRRIANPSLPYEHVRLRGRFFQGETIAPYAPIR